MHTDNDLGDSFNCDVNFIFVFLAFGIELLSFLKSFLNNCGRTGLGEEFEYVAFIDGLN